MSRDSRRRVSQNREVSERSLANLRPFKPGESGNPSGRPRGIIRRVRELTHDVDDLVDWMIGVWQGNSEQLGFIPSPKERMDAATWLADRGFGRPTYWEEWGVTAVQINAPQMAEVVMVPGGIMDDTSE